MATKASERRAFSWRCASGEHRQQLKWLAFGAAITIVPGLGSTFFKIHTPVAVPASTLTAAALFNPLRRCIRRGLDAVRGDLAQVVSSALEPAHLSGWLGNSN